jgi:hypothetical protein
LFAAFGLSPQPSGSHGHKEVAFEEFFAMKLDIGRLKMFDLGVCVKRTGS